MQLIDDEIFEGYENTKLLNYNELEDYGIQLVKFKDLKRYSGDGVLKACYYDENGDLVQAYTKDGNHVGVIAGTRLGKTTSYVIPTIVSFARQKVKKSFIVSDPKGEIYRTTSAELKKQGYKIILLNFRDFRHSAYWNPLTPIYRKYMRAMGIYDTVELVTVNGQPRNRFLGKVYEDQLELDAAIEDEKNIILDEVANDIDNFANMAIVTKSLKDPTWEDGARDLLKAILYGMLEDTQLTKNPITEDTFSLNTVFNITGMFEGDNSSSCDGGYFKNRPHTSKAYLLAKDVILIAAQTTRSCYINIFATKMAAFKEVVTRRITSCNSFEMSELADGPVALFLCYRDEIKSSYQTISLFVQDAYKYLIERATLNKNGKLSVPFYFILDEFGNFAPMKDYETVISACAGRNIWFILIMQSYAQLDAVYDRETAQIIVDNLNVKVMLGSNNYTTLDLFSRECGQYTRISPVSALCGSGAEIEQYNIETIPLITRSRLSHFEPGECIVTEANCGYVLLSRMERYFNCREFTRLPQSSESDYVCEINPMDKKYHYECKQKQNKFDW